MRQRHTMIPKLPGDQPFHQNTHNHYPIDVQNNLSQTISTFSNQPYQVDALSGTGRTEHSLQHAMPDNKAAGLPEMKYHLQHLNLSILPEKYRQELNTAEYRLFYSQLTNLIVVSYFTSFWSEIRFT
jgi:hypothetical protein